MFKMTIREADLPVWACRGCRGVYLQLDIKGVLSAQ